MNQDFIREACALADELSIDELVAAEIMLLCYQEESLSSSTLFLSSLSSFHVRRQYILDLVRFFLEQTGGGGGNPTTAAPMTTLYQKFVNRLSGPDMVKNALELMQEVEDGLKILVEKEKRGQILGQDMFHTQSMDLQREFLHRQHDTLGQILVGLVQNKILNPDNFEQLFNKFHKLGTYDTLFVHYIPCILAFGCAFDPVLRRLSFDYSIADGSKIIKLLTDSSKEWVLSYWQAAVQLIFCTFFAGLCWANVGKLGPEETEYHEVLQVIRSSIDDGALEFLMSLAADTKPTTAISTKFYDLRPSLQLRVPQMNYLSTPLSTDILKLLLSGLESLVEAFVTNLAEILREMKVTEEDSQLSEDNKDESRGLDLERLYVFISYLYMDRPDSSVKWFTDQEGGLFGFLVWACQSHIEFMSTTYCDMLGSLACGTTSSMHVFNFLVEKAERQAKSKKLSSCVSWNLILTTLEKYATLLKPKKSAQIVAGAKVVMQPSDVPELEQGQILFLCSYLRLMAEQLKYNDQVRSKVYNLKGSVTTILRLQVTQTPLLGPSLEVISGFANTPNRAIKEKIWELFDEWIFNSIIYSPDGSVLSPHMPVKDRLGSIFKSFTDVLGLVNLLQTFLIKWDESDLVYLPFPPDLGKVYRSPGLFPYVSFVINDVLFSSTSPELSLEDKLALQIPCLKFMLQSLDLFDEKIAQISAAVGINPDNVVQTQNFMLHLNLHPCSSVMSCIFDDKIYNLLISISAVGLDAVADLQPSNPIVQAVIYSIKIMNRVLDLQDVFLDVICKGAQGSVDFQHISSHGLRSFEDAILFNLPIVTHLAMYVSSANIELATCSLELFEKISLSTKFLSPVGSSPSSEFSTIKKNRMLSILETVDESIRIKEGFIEQLDRSISDYQEGTCEGLVRGSIDIKGKILSFLLATLCVKPNEPNLSHFLLGFTIKSDGRLALDDDVCGINSDSSVFQKAILLLIQSVDNASPVKLSYDPARFASIVSELLLQLVESPISSQLILDYLRDNDFFLNSLVLEPIIRPDALWDGRPFTKSNEFLGSKSPATLASFFKHRTALLNYFSLEIHTSAEDGSLSLLSRYLSGLANLEVSHLEGFAGGSAIVLSYLDALEFKVGLDIRLKVSTIDFFGVDIVRYATALMENDTLTHSVESLAYLFKLKGIDMVATGKLTSLEQREYVDALADVKRFFTLARAVKVIRESQLSCLSAWAKLVLILAIDTNMSPGLRSTFILETFQTIVPKLSAYSTTDAAFTSIFASIIVSLLQIYQEDMRAIGGELNLASGFDRTQSLFQTAMAAIMSPIATPDLRADLYITCSQYLKTAVELSDRDLFNANLQTLRTVGDRFIKLVCSDALSGDQGPRLVALVFLESISSVCVKGNVSFFLDSLVRYNLLLSLINSLKRCDQELSSNGDIIYESNVFKAILCLLLQIAQTRSGALQIVQCGFLKTLIDSQLLSVDPDVGIQTGFDGEHVSLYELLVPVFQLVSTVLISMGSENSAVIGRVKQFLDKHRQLVVSVLKRDVLQSSITEVDPKLHELVKLIVLLTTLTDYLN